MADVEVRLSGPLVDGRAGRIMDAAGRDAERAVAELGAQTVRSLVGRRARHPTGHFASRTVADRRSGGGLRVHTPGLRYGGWLEGTAHRNARSKFKGYGLYRQARQETEARATDAAGEVIARAARVING